MKFIVKNAEPSAFAEWKALENSEWQPAYPDLPGDIKQSLKASLMAEQGSICCYCEIRLFERDSHIEHFAPKSTFPQESLDYQNLLCSCQKKLDKGEPRHCGSLKGDWYDSRLLVSPLDQGCEKRFSYTGDGRKLPSDFRDQAAAETISRLGLNIPKLRDLRAKTIEPFLDDSLTDEDFRHFVFGYLEKDTEGKFGEFWTTIRHLFGGFETA
jgi:uncharacterized protein (TIGR02646 family)